MTEILENTLTAYLGAEFQKKLMWQLLVEPEFAEKVLPNLAIEYFDDPNLKRLFIIVQEFFKEYEKVPNFQNQSIHHAINKYKTPNNTIEEESLFSVIKQIELWNERIINKQMLHDGDVIQKATNDFIKQQEYRKIGEYILDKTKSSEIKNKYTIAYIEEKFQKISHIGEEKDDCEELTEGIDNALRKEFRQSIATGVEVIDALTGGGLGKGEIGLILTSSGIGKTSLLTVIANTAYEDERNVAQIIFEDSKEEIKRKHYTIWAKSALSRLNDEEENIRVKKIVHEKVLSLKGKGRLVIKKFSEENTTMVDVRNWMLSYQKKYGFKFDILVLDYLDCLESHKKSPDRTEAELHIVKSFIALASDFNIPAWSAIQGGRSSFGAEFVEEYHTGGSIKRVQKAHFFMSVAKTATQKEGNLANIRILKARFAKDGQTFEDAVFNNDTMEIRIEDDKYKFNKLSRDRKHYDEEDIDKLESDINKMHVAASQSLESISIEKVNTETINDVTKEAVFDNLQNSHKEQNKKSDDILELTSKIRNDNKWEDIRRKANKKFTTTLIGKNKIKNIIEDSSTLNFLETNDEIINESINKGLNEGLNKGLNLEPDIKYEIVSDDKGTNEIIIYNEPTNITKIDVFEIEKKLIDPDEVLVGHKSVYEMLKQERKNQNIIEKKNNSKK